MTRAMPPVRGIMAVDAVNFTRNPSVHQPDLSIAIPELLGRAFERSGSLTLWEDRRFPQRTGDGFVFGVPQEQTSFLLDPFLDVLQKVLEEYNRTLVAKGRNLRLRVRVAVHLGAVPDDGGERDRIGTPTNDTFRLLDSGPVKNRMKDSNPDVTLLAAIISQKVYEEVVKAGYTGDLHPDRFEHVIADVVEKEFAQPAWLYVPKPSRLSTQSTPIGPPGDAATAPETSGTTIHGDVTNSISGGTFSSEVRQHGGGES